MLRTVASQGNKTDVLVKIESGSFSDDLIPWSTQFLGTGSLEGEHVLPLEILIGLRSHRFQHRSNHSGSTPAERLEPLDDFVSDLDVR